MNISLIAEAISEKADIYLQELLDNYVKSIGTVEFESFSNYCLGQGIIIAEDVFVGLLANNNSFLFTEHEGTWLPTPLDDIELSEGLFGRSPD